MRPADEHLRPEQLADRAERVADLLNNHAGYAALRAELEADVERLRASILAGPKDDETTQELAVRYARQTGRLQGIMHALELPDVLIRQAPRETTDA